MLAGDPLFHSRSVAGAVLEFRLSPLLLKDSTMGRYYARAVINFPLFNVEIAFLSPALVALSSVFKGPDNSSFPSSLYPSEVSQ